MSYIINYTKWKQAVSRLVENKTNKKMISFLESDDLSEALFTKEERKERRSQKKTARKEKRAAKKGSKTKRGRVALDKSEGGGTYKLIRKKDKDPDKNTYVLKAKGGKELWGPKNEKGVREITNDAWNWMLKKLAKELGYDPDNSDPAVAKEALTKADSHIDKVNKEEKGKRDIVTFSVNINIEEEEEETEDESKEAKDTEGKPKKEEAGEPKEEEAGEPKEEADKGIATFIGAEEAVSLSEGNKDKHLPAIRKLMMDKFKDLKELDPLFDKYYGDSEEVEPGPNPENTLKFQQWVIDTKKDNTILGGGGASGYGDDGKMGPKSKIAWEKYGKDYVSGDKKTSMDSTTMTAGDAIVAEVLRAGLKLNDGKTITSFLVKKINEYEPETAEGEATATEPAEGEATATEPAEGETSAVVSREKFSGNIGLAPDFTTLESSFLKFDDYLKINEAFDMTKANTVMIVNKVIPSKAAPAKAAPAETPAKSAAKAAPAEAETAVTPDGTAEGTAEETEEIFDDTIQTLTADFNLATQASVALVNFWKGIGAADGEAKIFKPYKGRWDDDEAKAAVAYKRWVNTNVQPTINKITAKSYKHTLNSAVADTIKQMTDTVVNDVNWELIDPKKLDPKTSTEELKNLTTAETFGAWKEFWNTQKAHVVRYEISDDWLDF